VHRGEEECGKGWNMLEAPGHSQRESRTLTSLQVDESVNTEFS
jgi:hypothetical protein